MRCVSTFGLIGALLLAPPLALGQEQPMQQGQGQGQGQGGPPANGADQLVGLFGATCLHFAGDVSGLRAFLTQQGAPQMPEQARQAFLAGRAGQVYDVSVPNVNLALVSLDDGGCEAVVEKADPAQVLSTLQQQAADQHLQLQNLGGQPDKSGRDVQHTAFLLTANGRQMHILASTAPAPPQAVLTLVPR